jgi:hypothetical protein
MGGMNLVGEGSRPTRPARRLSSFGRSSRTLLPSAMAVVFYLLCLAMGSVPYRKKR